MMTATAERTPCENRIYILPSNVATYLSPKYKELGHFTVLFCRGRQRNAPKLKTHVRIYFFPLRRADLFFSGFAVEFAGYVWTVAVSGTKKFRIRKYLDTCGRGLNANRHWNRSFGKIGFHCHRRHLGSGARRMIF